MKNYCARRIARNSAFTPVVIFSRASRMLRGATQPVRMPCVTVCVRVCLCVEIFFLTNPYLQAGLTDLDEIWHDGRS